jgi:hypothetical protein
MKKLILFILLVLLFSACTQRNKEEALKLTFTENSKENYIHEDSKLKYYESLDFAKTTNQSDTSTFILIDKTTAIIIYPDTTWINEQQKMIGEDGWNEIVADHEYYQSEAITTLENNRINIAFYDTNKRYYKFIKSDKSIYCIDKTKMKDKWGLILFSPDKNPVFWLDTTIDEAMNDIFKQNNKQN